MNQQNTSTIISRDLKLLLWNVRSCRRIKEELPKILQELDILICLESRLNEVTTLAQEFIFPGFLTFRKDRPNASAGGIAIFIRKNLAFREITNLSIPDQRVEMSAIQLTNIQPQITLVVCYRPPGFTLSQENWNKIVSNVKSSQVKSKKIATIKERLNYTR